MKEEAQVQKGFCGTDCAADCQSETEDFPYVPFSFTYPHRCDLWKEKLIKPFSPHRETHIRAWQKLPFLQSHV